MPASLPVNPARLFRLAQGILLGPGLVHRIALALRRHLTQVLASAWRVRVDHQNRSLVFRDSSACERKQGERTDDELRRPARSTPVLGRDFKTGRDRGQRLS